MTNRRILGNIIRAKREGGGTGRRVRLRGVWLSVWVQVPSFTPKKGTGFCPFFFLRLVVMGLERAGVGGIKPVFWDSRRRNSPVNCFSCPGVIATPLCGGCGASPILHTTISGRLKRPLFRIFGENAAYKIKAFYRCAARIKIFRFIRRDILIIS